MRRVQLILCVVLAAILAACTATVRDELEGNNTGGVIPPALAKGRDVQNLANAHCAKYGATARITFPQSQTGGDTVFVCETPSGPAMLPAPSGTKQAPTTKQAPRSG